MDGYKRIPAASASLSEALALGRAFWQLTKPRVVALLVLTAWVGMMLASTGLPDLALMAVASLGIAMVAGAAAAFNHVLDQKIDARMARTRMRPLPTGRLSNVQAVSFAFALAAAGFALLLLAVNALTAWLTLACLFGYAVIYTVFLKRATPQNIVIGGLAGAAPPALGWAAVKGWPAGVSFWGLAGAPLHYDHALLLVLIIYVWTPPHFWALAIFRRDDYAKALIPMLPVVYGVTYTRWQILFYTVLLLVVTVLPYVAGMSGVFYLGGALVLGAVFLWYAIRLLNPPSEWYAMQVFNYSIVYLMALFAFLLADHWLLPQVAATAAPTPTPPSTGRLGLLGGRLALGRLWGDEGGSSRTITTTDPGAQRYFNQGMVLGFDFNHAEAIRSFILQGRSEIWGAGAEAVLFAAARLDQREHGRLRQ